MMIFFIEELKLVIFSAFLAMMSFCMIMPVSAAEIALDDSPLELSNYELRYTEDLTQLKQRRVIRALLVPSRTDFYITEGKIDGLMVRFLDSYEKQLNKGIKKEAEKTRIIYVPVNFDDLIPALLDGRGDIAASFLTLTDEREQQVAFASGRSMKVNELIVTHSNIELSTIEDLAGKDIYALRNSSYVEHLQDLNNTFLKRGIKAINIVEAEEYLSSEDILEMLNAGAIDITVIDDFKATLWAKVLPNITVRTELIINDSGSLGWAVRKTNPELQKSLQTFVKTVKKGSYLGNMLFQQFYGRDLKLASLNQKQERQKYTQLIKIFKKYSDQYNINHLKLLAQAYQESGLNQNMKSHRGAVGIMQLLPSTAADKNVNIGQIDKLENNIHAGAKYMHFLRNRYFSGAEIDAENQIFFAWAAYNAGPANVRKMRNLAEKMGLDKNIWFNNVEIAAGKLIGTETVRYVSNIYKYYSTYLLMEQQERAAQESARFEENPRSKTVSLWAKIKDYLSNTL